MKALDEHILMGVTGESSLSCKQNLKGVTNQMKAHIQMVLFVLLLKTNLKKQPLITTNPKPW